MSSEEVRTPGLYFTVIDGTFRTKVDATHPQAVAREYETKDGAKAVKHERIVNSISGYIEDIAILESDFGRVINIKLDKNAEGKHPIIQLSAENTYGEDFLKKLPSIDLTNEVKISPYAFTDDNGKDLRGVSITQHTDAGDIKVGNFFYDAERKEAQNGFPVPEGDTEQYEKDDWKIHFMKVRKFLIAYATEHILPKLAYRGPRTPKEVAPDINPEDIPF